MQRIFITGANRGIGLELTRQCLTRGDHVFAAARQPEKAEELQKLQATYGEQLTILKLEVTDPAEIESAAQAVSKAVDSLDVLINNAGILPRDEQLDTLEAERMLHALHVNSVAPMMIVQALGDLLKSGAGAKIINVTSRAGSLGGRRVWDGRYSYCASKSALNMLTKTLAAELEDDGIITMMIHPGWASTDMGGSNAPVSPPESAAGILQVIDKLTPEDNASFVDWEGKVVPW